MYARTMDHGMKLKLVSEVVIWKMWQSSNPPQLSPLLLMAIRNFIRFNLFPYLSNSSILSGSVFLAFPQNEVRRLKNVQSKHAISILASATRWTWSSPTCSIESRTTWIGCGCYFASFPPQSLAQEFLDMVSFSVKQWSHIERTA